MNQIEITGTIAREDCVVKISQSGKSWCTFTVCSPEGGNGKQELEYFDVVCFGGLADKMGIYGKHKVPVLIKGKLKINSWKDRNGVTRKTPQITASFIAIDKVGLQEPTNEVDAMLQDRTYLDNENTDVSDIKIESDDLPF